MGLGGAGTALVEKVAASALEGIRAEILDEYRQDHVFPWIVGYSGGKDSTLESDSKLVSRFFKLLR